MALADTCTRLNGKLYTCTVSPVTIGDFVRPVKNFTNLNVFYASR